MKGKKIQGESGGRLITYARGRLFTDQEIYRAERHGISYQTLYYRVTVYGWDIDRATTEPTSGKFGNNKTKQVPQDLIDKAEENGVNYALLLNRVNRYGWSLEDSVNTPPLKKGFKKNGFREKYQDELIEAEKNGINHLTFYSRVMKYGWDVERAIKEPPRNYRKKETL